MAVFSASSFPVTIPPTKVYCLVRLISPSSYIAATAKAALWYPTCKSFRLRDLLQRGMSLSQGRQIPLFPPFAKRDERGFS